MFQTIQIKPGKLRTRRRIRRVVIGTLVGLFATCVVLIAPIARSTGETKRTVAMLRSVPCDRLRAAVQTFARDRKTKGIAQSTEVPLRELVSGGYFPQEDFHGLESKDAMVSLSVSEGASQEVLIRVHASQHHDLALLADGSVRELRRQ